MQCGWPLLAYGMPGCHDHPGVAVRPLSGKQREKAAVHRPCAETELIILFHGPIKLAVPFNPTLRLCLAPHHVMKVLKSGEENVLMKMGANWSSFNGPW